MLDDCDMVAELRVMIRPFRIVELAYRANPDGDPAILTEGQVAITRYLQGYSPTRARH